MGKLLTFDTNESTQDFYPPINPRDLNSCLLVRLDDVIGVVGVMVALGESNTNGFHAVRVRSISGLLIRHVLVVGQLCILTSLDSIRDKRTLSVKDVTIVGSVIQFICNWETGERWELVKGAACEGVRTSLTPQVRQQIH